MVQTTQSPRHPGQRNGGATDQQRVHLGWTLFRTEIISYVQKIQRSAITPVDIRYHLYFLSILYLTRFLCENKTGIHPAEAQLFMDRRARPRQPRPADLVRGLRRLAAKTHRDGHRIGIHDCGSCAELGCNLRTYVNITAEKRFLFLVACNLISSGILTDYIVKYSFTVRCALSSKVLPRCRAVTPRSSLSAASTNMITLLGSR